MSTELILGSIGAFVTLLFFILTIASFLWMARCDYRHLDAKIDAIKEDGRIFREKWAEESKEFHGRLEKRDAEFKAFMKAEEVKRTKILTGK